MKKNFLKNSFIFLFIIQIIKVSIEDGIDTIEVFNQGQYLHGQFVYNSKGDMIIEYTKDKSTRLFYGIKKNGKGFFDGEYIKLSTFESGKNLHEFTNIFVSFNNSNDDNQYLFSFGKSDSVCELYDIEDTNTYDKIKQFIWKNDFKL